jgi:hypothetical protein
MPLMRPEIQEVLRAAGLAPEATKKDSRPLSEKLDAAGLSLEETLEELAILVKSSGNDSLRARCLETVLKAHGALKESAPAAPSFTIVIQETLGNGAVAQPLQGTEKIPVGVNPILLPRQLIKSINGEDTSQFNKSN